MNAINMDYCKFENTVMAVEQCLEGWNNQDMSAREQDAKSRLYELCQYIVENMDIEWEDGDDA